jgi:penicillin-binding protein-related factor A (putative recombinase)
LLQIVTVLALDGIDVINFIDNNKRKSIPYEYINKNGIKVDFNYLKGVNYIPAVEELIRRKNEKENKS